MRVRDGSVSVLLGLGFGTVVSAAAAGGDVRDDGRVSVLLGFGTVVSAAAGGEVLGDGSAASVLGFDVFAGGGVRSTAASSKSMGW